MEQNLIVSNTVTSGSNDDVYVNADSNSSGTFEDNTVANNTATGSNGAADGPTTMDVWGTIDLEHNNFVNPANTYEMSTNNGTGTLDAEHSWWGTTTSSAILARLYDAHLNNNYGNVDYSNWLSGPDPNAPAMS